MFLDNYHYLKNKEIYISILLFLFSFFSRIPVIILFGDTSLEYEWLYLVSNLIEHGQLVYQTFDNGFLLPNLWMPPLYAYYLYIFSFFNLENQNYIFLVLATQIVLASISVIIFYKINKLFFSRKISFFSSLIFSLFPLHLYACSQISSISLQTFLSIFFIYFFLQITNKKDLLSVIYFSITAGLLILLRGEFWFIFLLTLLYLFLFLKIKMKKILLIASISLIITSPYLIRNFLIFEKITVLQSLGYNLWKGNHPLAKENSIVEGVETTNENILEQIDALKIDKYYRIKWDGLFLDLAIKNLKEDPPGHLIFYFKKITSYIFINFRSHDPRYWNPLHFIPLLLFGITSLIGIILSDKKSRQLNYLILLFFVIVGIFSTFSIMPRYKLVILPLQIIFTNVLIKRIKEKFFNRGKNN